MKSVTYRITQVLRTCSLPLRAALLATIGMHGTALAGDIAGKVNNPALNRPMAGARVMVVEIDRMTFTDTDGSYRITNLPAGDFTLRIDQAGYESYTMKVTVPAQGVVTADAVLALTGVAEGGEIVVTGARASRLLALERKRTATTIRDVISSDLIGKLPDYNTAEALQRLPGVSVEIDQSEPRYVVIRGVDPNLNQVTIDGNLVGAPEAEGRRVALDTIASDLVAAIEVVKAVTPDYDANAVGGSINIVTPTAFDRSDDFLYLTGRGLYADKAEKFGFGASGTYGTRFGPDGKFGVVVGASYLKRFIDSDLAEPINWTTVAPGVSSPTSFQLFDYRIMRERIGGILNLDWRPNSEIRIYIRNIYNEFTDEEERDKINFNIARGTITVDSPTQIRFSRGRATREFRQNNQTQKLINISPGAEFNFNNWKMDVNYTYAHAEEHTPVRDDIEFRSADVLGSTIDITNPLPDLVAIDPRFFDVAAFPLRRLRLREEEIDEDLHAFRADIRYDFEGGLPGYVKFGTKFTGRKKTRDNRQQLFLPTAAITSTTAGSVLPPPEDFFNGVFQFGPTIDYRAFLDFFEANPNLFALDAASTLINDNSLDYDIHEKIYAGYAMAELRFGDLSAIGGVRIERTDARYAAFAIRDSNGNGTLEPADILPLTFSNKYTDVLPSIHLNYQLSPDAVIRAAWTNTLGRPDYDASVPTFQEDGGVGTAGNPDLQPFRSLGFDLSAEYYPDAESILSAAVFYKRIKNPIFTRTIQGTSFAGIPLTSLSQPQNADDGYILGVEANVQRRFTFLPAPFDGFGVSVNATYTTSEVNVPGRENENIPFFRQADWIANAALFYEKGPFEARFAVNYRDDFIVNIGDSAASDIYDQSRTVFDARASYRILEGVEIFASVSNFGDTALTFFQTTSNQIFSKQIYSFNADFGVSLNF